MNSNGLVDLTNTSNDGCSILRKPLISKGPPSSMAQNWNSSPLVDLTMDADHSVWLGTPKSSESPNTGLSHVALPFGAPRAGDKLPPIRHALAENLRQSCDTLPTKLQISDLTNRSSFSNINSTASLAQQTARSSSVRLEVQDDISSLRAVNLVMSRPKNSRGFRTSTHNDLDELNGLHIHNRESELQLLSMDTFQDSLRSSIQTLREDLRYYLKVGGKIFP